MSTDCIVSFLAIRRSNSPYMKSKQQLLCFAFFFFHALCTYIYSSVRHSQTRIWLAAHDCFESSHHIKYWQNKHRKNIIKLSYCVLMKADLYTKRKSEASTMFRMNNDQMTETSLWFYISIPILCWNLFHQDSYIHLTVLIDTGFKSLNPRVLSSTREEIN